MSANGVEEIEQRLTRLEGEVKRWKSAATATTVLLAVLIACDSGPRTRAARAADSSAKDLVARSLTIVDEHGTRRILLNNSSWLGLYDEKGFARAILAINRDGSAIELDDEKGIARAALAIHKVGPRLELDDKNGMTRAILEDTKNGPAMDLRDEKGKSRATLFGAKDGGGLVLDDENEMRRASLLTSDKGGPALRLHDEKGKQRAVFGSAHLETTRTGATEATGPSSVTLFDKNGKLIWRAP